MLQIFECRYDDSCRQITCLLIRLAVEAFQHLKAFDWRGLQKQITHIDNITHASMHRENIKRNQKLHTYLSHRSADAGWLLIDPLYFLTWGASRDPSLWCSTRDPEIHQARPWPQHQYPAARLFTITSTRQAWLYSTLNAVRAIRQLLTMDEKSLICRVWPQARMHVCVLDRVSR